MRLRLDCDRDNQRLRAYYEAQGFRHVRDVDGLPWQTRPGGQPLPAPGADRALTRRYAGPASAPSGL
jgi:hypothetical protein